MMGFDVTLGGVTTPAAIAESGVFGVSACSCERGQGG